MPDRAGWEALYAGLTGLAEWERDKALIDALDELINADTWQRTYTLDPANRTPAGGERVVVDTERNPCEFIVDALTECYGTTENIIRDKVRLATYLISVSPSFQIQR